MPTYTVARLFWISAFIGICTICLHGVVTRGESRVIFDKLLETKNVTAHSRLVYVVEAHLEDCENKFNYTFNTCGLDDQFLRYNSTHTAYTVYTDYCAPAGGKFFLYALGMVLAGYSLILLFLL
nr:hypothetical protein K-LCC10_0158 [Kaumoebavirus]